MHEISTPKQLQNKNNKIAKTKQNKKAETLAIQPT